MTTKYESTLRKSSNHNLKGQVFRPDQIVLNHEHTKAEPFKLRVDERCSEKKGSVYKRNAEQYEAQLRSSLQSNKSRSRAEDRLAHFKQAAGHTSNAKVMENYDYSQRRANNHNNVKLEPFALFCDRYGKRVPSANKSESRQSSESSIKRD